MNARGHAIRNVSGATEVLGTPRAANGIGLR
jgi:hypothetical protein